jgi:peroxiredoxin/outer membrane murein-binding lipoprotein Lpp
MKSIIYKMTVAALVVLPSLLYGQSSNYKLTGKIGHYSAPAKAYLFNKLTGHTDSALMVNGNFQFQGTVGQPVAVALVINRSGTGIRVKDLHLPTVELYLEPGKITVISPDSLKTSQISGGPINMDNNHLNDAKASVNAKIAKLKTEYQAATSEKKMSKDFIADIQQRYQALKGEQMAVYVSFVKNNPNSLVSLFAIKAYAGPIPDVNIVEPLYNSLSADIRSSEPGTAYGNEIKEMKKTAIGAIAPDFSMADTANKMVALHDFRGKYVLLDFWASWCGPCRAENPNIVKAYEAYKGKNFTILGVSLDLSRNNWLKAIHDDHLDWTQVSDLKFWQNGAAQLYSIRGIPQNYLIDPQGKIVARNIQGDDLNKKLQEISKN